MKHGRVREAPATRDRRHRPTGWEQVWQGDGEAQAEIVAQGLEASGIRVRVAGSPISTPYTNRLQLSAWAILVPTHEAVRARELLRERQEGSRVVSGELGVVSYNFRVLMRLAVPITFAVAFLALFMALRAAT